jgi:hypothetical protein
LNGVKNPGTPLLILVAEKSTFLEPFRILNILRVLAARLSKTPQYLKAGLIVYAARPLPLVDPTTEAGEIVRAYEEAPILEGPPNPATALREAGEMALDYLTPLTTPRVAVVFWSLKSRPRRVLRVAGHYLAQLGFKLALIAFTSKRRPWLQRYLPPGSLVVEVDSTGRPERVAETIMGLLGATGQEG